MLVLWKQHFSLEGTPKQFDSSGEIQIENYVFFLAFWPIPLSHATKKLDIFSILSVALSHCDKDLFCLSHRVTATNGFFGCRTESLRQTKLVYVAPKMPKWLKNVEKNTNKVHNKLSKNPQKVQKKSKN